MITEVEKDYKENLPLKFYTTKDLYHVQCMMVELHWL